MSSSVFLSNVDDYLSPSQACVNPLFSEKTNAPTEEAEKPPVIAPPTNGSVVPRRRRPRPNPDTAPVFKAVVQEQDPVKASIADCLACSGCVTTAETVLLEETHSLQLVRDRWGQQTSTAAATVATISPAAWADLMRHAGMNVQDVSEPETYRSLQRQWTSLLAESLGITHIMDGNLALQWSLEASAQEFCRARRQSEASSSLLSSSCPAVVCLVEKSSHGAVAHLSTTASPQGMAGRFWKSSLQQPVFHMAIMPCHDKKLEASRPTLMDPTADKDNAEVDLVLTTQDCVKLVLERWQVLGNEEENKDLLRRRLLEAPLSNIVEMVSSASNPAQSLAMPTLLVPPLAQVLPTTSAETSSDNVFVYGSGGYADYIFRYACRTLFRHEVLPEHLPWRPVQTTSNRRRVSARVAAASVQRDYYEVNLYIREDGSYTLNRPEDKGKSKPVLSFAIAYGMQTLQRVLAPFEKDSSSEDAPKYHYVEAMACPSGCVNGGGQLRVADRERPTQTRERVHETRQRMHRPQSGVTPPSWMSDQAMEFRVVAPLQLAQGAVKGVAVQDVQW
jgi:iron only hydrogenase large subunit-like protein